MFSNLKDILKDKLTEKIDEVTNGQVLIDSGLIKIDGNKYVEQVLSSLNEKLKEKALDQWGLPTQSVEFEKAVACGIILPGQAEMDNGSISGLASFDRMEDTKIEINVFGDPLVSLTASIGIKRAAVDYAVTLKVFCLSQEAAVEGILSDIKIAIGLRVNRSFNISMDKFDLKYNGDLELRLKGFEAFQDVLSDTISAELQTSVKEAVLDYLQKNVKALIGDIVTKLGIDSI